MAIISWIILGAVLGVAAALVLRSHGRHIAALISVGSVGAVLGGFLVSITQGLDVGDVNSSSLWVAAVGGLILIGLLQTVPEPYD
jgi:uncharacterized membrane protein YeaQ/YmgE (transglycosylase-associated protein family)